MGPGDLRVSDVEREQVQQFLSRAMVAGLLTPAEYSDRAAAALAARVRRDLEGLLDDLPGASLHAVGCCEAATWRWVLVYPIDGRVSALNSQAIKGRLADGDCG